MISKQFRYSLRIVFYSFQIFVRKVLGYFQPKDAINRNWCPPDGLLKTHNFLMPRCGATHG
jgi:hypothetical protein